jgi:ankyrin repeat protein
MTLKLFERQAELNVKTDPFNWYLLHECIVNAPEKVFKNIVKYADFTVKTSDGKNPLMVAIENNKFERAMYLLENKKAVIYDKDKNKRTALHYAALKNNQEIFIELVKRGANIFEEDKDKKNPIDLLTDEIFRNSLPKLLEKMKIELSIPKKDNNLSIENIIVEKDLNTIVEEKTKKSKISSLSKIVKKN